MLDNDTINYLFVYKQIINIKKSWKSFRGIMA